MTDELLYIHLNKQQDHIRMLRYFDAMSEQFYHDFFTHVIPDNETFSMAEIQQYLVDTITSKESYTFRFWDREPLPGGVQIYANKGCIISYSIKSDKMEYLKIEIMDNVFERKLIV